MILNCQDFYPEFDHIQLQQMTAQIKPVFELQTPIVAPIITRNVSRYTKLLFSLDVPATNLSPIKIQHTQGERSDASVSMGDEH